jgi:hypothetical protein
MDMGLNSKKIGAVYYFYLTLFHGKIQKIYRNKFGVMNGLMG